MIEVNQFIEDIKECLKKRGGKNSISCLFRDLKDMGWKRLGKLYEFESALEKHGFNIEHRRPKGYSNVTGTFISIKE